MQIGRVVGQAVATIKHASMQGWRLLVIQLLTMDGKEDGEPILAIDHLGAAMGADVLVSSDGAGVRELLRSKTSPVRWFVMGLCDA